MELQRIILNHFPEALARFKVFTCHVTNVCHALILADKTEQNGKAYFLTDGETPVFKDFIKKYVGTQGVSVPDKAISLTMAKFVASIMEFVWRIFKLKGHPPLYKGLVNTLGLEFITIDKKARQELGYTSPITIEHGLKLMRS